MEYTIRPTRLEDMEGFNALRRMPGVFSMTQDMNWISICRDLRKTRSRQSLRTAI